MKVRDVISPNLIPGDPMTVHGLGIVPLISNVTPDIPAIDLLEEALDEGALRITEVSEEGAVSFLRAENNGLKPVLILDGEELVGGKQNRIVNAAIIILPSAVMDIPVSCTEAGRWRNQRKDFSSGEAVFRTRGRAVHRASVTSSLHRKREFQSNQSAVWEEVNLCLAEMDVSSATSDFRVGRAKVAHQIDFFTEAIHTFEHQVGSIFLSKHGVLGVELLAVPDLFIKCLPKIVRSYAFEVLADDSLSIASIGLAARWWEKILEAPLSQYSSPGTGEDIRVNLGSLIGSGLVWDGNLIHFSCFPRHAL